MRWHPGLFYSNINIRVEILLVSTSVAVRTSKGVVIYMHMFPMNTEVTY